MSDYGYVRVSTKYQNEARQIAAMKQAGISPENTYIDRLSGKDFNRPNYQKLKKKLREGDVIFVPSIDRLGRNYEEILDEWRDIVKVKHADIVVLDMPLLDTRVKGDANKDVMAKVITDIVLQLLAYVAEQERENIKERQAEGIACAKENGVKFGRRNVLEKIDKDALQEMFVLYSRHEINSRNAAVKLGISSTTFLKLFKELFEKNI